MLNLGSLAPCFVFVTVLIFFFVEKLQPIIVQFDPGMVAS